MKKIVFLLLALSMTIALVACNAGSGNQTTHPSEQPSNTGSISQSEKEKDMLVVYFSCTGTTERIAQDIAEILGADLYQIIPEDPYTDEDLAYYTGGRADQEQNDASARPAISGEVENMDQYDTVLMGYPIWHGQAPRIISTFLESYDFTGKTIVPFCTSQSSAIGTSASDLHALCPDATWLEGERFAADTSEVEIEDWLETIGIAAEHTAKMGEFNFETRTVMLNSGYEMPIMGLGTYSLSDEECYNSVTALLQAGGRLIDTAYMYHNEASVGRAVR